MQPSKQLRGLVESYSDVYGDRDQRNALRAECKSIINCVGVHMVESGFTEQDVKEFFETASIGKILQKFEESKESEKVAPHLNDEGLFETNRVNIPGACAARINESILGRIIREAYTVNVADKKGNTKAYQNYKSGMKNKLNGKPLYKAGPGVEEAKNGGDNDPCWDTHKQVGMKKKGGKMVPNCVPKEEVDNVDEMIDPKGAARMDAAKGKKKETQDEINKRLMLGKYSPKKMGETYKPIDKKKETAMYRRAGNLSRDALSKGMSTKAGSKAQDKSSNIVTAIARQKEKERFAKMGDEKARSNYGESVDKITFFLVSEGLADTFRGAERMVEGLSEEFINEILDLALIEEKMVQGIIEMGEAADADEARYILSELDEETLDALAEDVRESDEDRLRDRRMEYGGGDGNTRYDRPARSGGTQPKMKGKTQLQKDADKKYGAGTSAMDRVKASIRAKYGKDSLK